MPNKKTTIDISGENNETWYWLAGLQIKQNEKGHKGFLGFQQGYTRYQKSYEEICFHRREPAPEMTVASWNQTLVQTLRALAPCLQHPRTQKIGLRWRRTSCCLASPSPLQLRWITPCYSIMRGRKTSLHLLPPHCASLWIGKIYISVWAELNSPPAHVSKQRT